jgi:hypothetical protein
MIKFIYYYFYMKQFCLQCVTYMINYLYLC